MNEPNGKGSGEGQNGRWLRWRRKWGENPAPHGNRWLWLLFVAALAIIGAVLFVLPACAVASGEGATANVGTVVDSPSQAPKSASSPLSRMLGRD